MEHKLELDAIKNTADKMHKTLDDTHKQLHDEAARRFALENEAAKWKMEADRARDLTAQMATERYSDKH